MTMQRSNKIYIWSISILFVLISALVVHIYASTYQEKNDARIRQMSRIDFKQPIDSLEAAKIRGIVKRMKGVDATKFNVKTGTLVYSYIQGMQTSENVYNELMKLGNYKAAPYITDNSGKTNGCPVVGNKDSFTYRVTVYFSNLFS